MSDPQRDPKRSWLDEPEHRGRLFYGLVGLCVALLGVDLLELYDKDRAQQLGFLQMPGFFGLMAFGATVGLVQGAYALRARLRRGEGYYDE